VKEVRREVVAEPVEGEEGLVATVLAELLVAETELEGRSEARLVEREEPGTTAASGRSAAATGTQPRPPARPRPLPSVPGRDASAENRNGTRRSVAPACDGRDPTMSPQARPARASQADVRPPGRVDAKPAESATASQNHALACTTCP